MKLLADMHISPQTVEFLRRLQYDVVRVNEVLDASASDLSVMSYAAASARVVLTQDLDFSALMALSGRSNPSIITLRLASCRVEHVNQLLEKVLPAIEQDALDGCLISVEEQRVRIRPLPLE